jgi:structural maintenance of chromosomes protein 6
VTCCFVCLSKENTYRVKIDNDLVKRQLIIQQGIDQTILIADREEAIRVMYDGPRLNNVRQCFCFNSAKRGWGHRLALSGNGEQNVSPIKVWDRAARMKSDDDSQIKYVI